MSRPMTFEDLYKEATGKDMTPVQKETLVLFLKSMLNDKNKEKANGLESPGQQGR